jgi:hypothetical protein
LGGVRKKETIFPVLKVPRQCPLVLLVEAAHMVGIRFFIIIIFFLPLEGSCEHGDEPSGSIKWWEVL